MRQSQTHQPTYPEEDHETWHKLYVRQMELVRDVACREFHDWLPKLAIEFNRLPDQNVMEQRIHSFTGWTLADA